MSETPLRTFDERLAAVHATLSRWIYRNFGYTFPETEDCLQAASIELWQAYRKEPDRLDSASDGLWVVLGRYAIRNHLHRTNLQVCRRQGKRCTHRRAEQVIFTQSDIVAKDGEAGEVEDILSSKAFARNYGDLTRGRNTPEMSQADLRMDLERLLKKGYTSLEKRYHANMRKLMLDIMLGYKLVESQQRHGWTQNQTATLMRLMRNVFREAATGEKVPSRSYRSCEPADPAREIKRIQELRMQGLSYAKIGAVIGRSTSFVQRKLKPPVPRDVSKLESIYNLRRQGLSYARIGQAVGCSKSHVQRTLSAAQYAA